MAKRTLTDTFLKALRPAPPGKREHHWDLQVHRFGVRVSDRGTKSFILYTRVPPGRMPARLWLGDANDLSLAAARKKARDWLDIIAKGRDPREDARRALLAEQRARRITFGAVFEAWLQDVVRGKQRQARAVENEVRRGLLPHWGNRPITEITARDVRDVIGKIKVQA